MEIPLVFRVAAPREHRSSDAIAFAIIALFSANRRFLVYTRGRAHENDSVVQENLWEEIPILLDLMARRVGRTR